VAAGSAGSAGARGACAAHAARAARAARAAGRNRAAGCALAAPRLRARPPRPAAR
jgi:hypothetical protein